MQPNNPTTEHEPTDPRSLNNGWVVYRRLLSHVRPYSFAFVFVLIGMSIVAVTEVGFAALMEPLIDDTFVDKDPQWIAMIPFVIIGIFILRGIGSFFGTFCMAWVGRRVTRDLRSQMFHHVVNLPTHVYDVSTSGQMISRITFDAEQVADASSNALKIIVQDSLTLIGLLAYMFYQNWRLAILFLIMGR